MEEKFANKYRIPSARLQNWNYASEGAYFITICTKNRVNYFGEIENGKMVLSNKGIIADLMWYEIKNHAKNIKLGEFVVMPNHIHGILILNDNLNTTIVSNANVSPTVSTTVETRHALSLPSEPSEPSKPSEPFIGQMRFQNQGKNTISSIIGSYKSAVTKHCNRLGFEFAWQPLFYDHIIRDTKSFENIQNYIANNPANWVTDKFHENE